MSPDQPPAPDPSVTFPLMKQLGFNLARVDNLDWNYMYQNQSQCQQLLEQVANYADQSGVSCIYHFGGQNSNVMPRALTSLYSSISAFYDAWWANQTIPSGRYAGLTLWEASYQGFWKPVLQAVDSHKSTIGYGLWNEPSGLPNSPGPLVTLHNYYTYITQRIRSVSKKVITFQVTSNGGGDASSIAAVAPTQDLLPYAFEGHMYSYDPAAFAGWAQGVQKIGGYGLLGEWHVSPSDSNLEQDITLYLNLVKQYGFATTWYSWTCGGNTDLLQPTSCQPTSECQLLSTLYTKVLGTPSYP
ncbi:MAG: cellulase family glycosylhydrolase [Conexivisphaerales archaeon]